MSTLGETDYTSRAIHIMTYQERDLRNTYKSNISSIKL